MKVSNRKFMSIALAIAIGAGFTAVPAYADPEDRLTVSNQRFYRITNNAADDGYDAYEEVEAPVDGVFKDIVTWGADDNYGPITGSFRSEIDISGGSGSAVTLYGAVYEEENQLAGIAFDSKAAAEESDTLSVTTEINDGQTYKAMIWNENLQPIETQAKAPVIRYFYCDDPNTVTIAWNDEGGSYTLYKNGSQVDITGLTTVSEASYRNMGKYPVYIYTDTSAATGDSYVVKNNGVSSETLTADFTPGAYITMGKYVTGRNMAYMRNNNAQWWHNSVSQHRNVAGRECDVRVYKTYNANDKKNEKWTNFYFKLDGDYISGSGNTVDVTIDYFDYGTEPLWLYYYPDSDPSKTVRVAAVENMGNTKTWKTAVCRISGVTFAADAGLDGGNQLMLTSGTGSAIASVSVAPYVNTTVTNVRAANTYTDGVELRWTMESTSGITGYTIKRNGTTIATNYKQRVYYDKGLAADTAYSYTVTAESPYATGTESSACATRTKPNKYMTMTLPLKSGYTTNTTSSSSSEAGTSGEDYTENGLTFRLCNTDRWRRSTTVARLRGGKYCRATVMRNTQGSMTRPALSDYYDWNVPSSNRSSSQMLFSVDNSIISTSQRDIIIEFDYFGDSNSDQSSIEVKYLKYNNGDTPTVATKFVTMTKDNSWHNAKVTIDNAQLDKSHVDANNLNDGGGLYYDIQLGMGGNRGGFASTNVKVYVPGCVPMPDHEVSAEVNAAGTAFEGTLPISNWGSYDRNIGFSGTDGMSAVGGKQFAYNREYTEYGSETWKQWANAFCFKVPDDVLYGSDYTRVEVDVEYYAPTSGTTMKLLTKNTSGSEISVEDVSAATGAWTTKTFVITSTDGKNIVFNNGTGGDVDFRITFDKQAYIHKVTVRKDIIED